MWPFNLKFNSNSSSNRSKQRRDSDGWDKYRLLSEQSSSNGSGMTFGVASSSSRSLSGSELGTSKEWESSYNQIKIQNIFFNRKLEMGGGDEEVEEGDSFLPTISGRSKSGSKNRSTSFFSSPSSILTSILSFILNSPSRIKRSPIYIKLILLSIFIFISYHSISFIFLNHISTNQDSIFQNPSQAIQLLQSLTSISSSSTTQNNDDPTRIIFKDFSPGLSSTKIVPIKSYELISDQCLESWISKGEWNSNQGCSKSLNNDLDSIHAVVNGSDLVQISSRHFFRPDSPLNMDSNHRYADHNELLFSMRSFRNSLKKGNEIWKKSRSKLNGNGNGIENQNDEGFGLKKMHILASAYPLDYQIELIQNSLDQEGSLIQDETEFEEIDKDQDSLNSLFENHRIHREPTPLDLIERSPNSIEDTIGAGSLGKGRTLSGQVPSWLKKSTTTGEGVEIEVHHDSEYFAPLPTSPDQIPSDSEVKEWRERVIPTFNSLSVESQIYNLPTTSTSSDSIVYLNDDFFTLLPTSTSDYNSPLFGPVIKSLARITSMYWPSEYPIWRYWNPAGEEVGVKRAAWVLGQRFPMRAYPYITHHPRSLSLPLLREAAQTFPEAFGDTALSRFRAQQSTPISIQAVFLGSWYIVQRHREALLWSWLVAKWGGENGEINQEKRDLMWNELTNFNRFEDERNDDENHSLKINSKNSHQVFKPNRSSLRQNSENSLLKSGLQPSLNTEYDFSSNDGYALSYLDHLWFWQRKEKHGFPDLSSSTSSASSKTKLCQINKDRCLGSKGKIENASELFKKISFQDQECGDCFIPALISLSGEKGLDAFLPSSDQRIPNVEEFEKVEDELKKKNLEDKGDWELEIEHLPITKDWKSTDFSLKDVVKPNIVPSSSEIFQNLNPRKKSQSQISDSKIIDKESRKLKRSRSLRIWTTRLIHRYSYILGTSESELYQMKWTDKVSKRLKDLDYNQGEFSKIENWLNVNEDDDDEKKDDIGKEKKKSDFKGKPLTFLALNDDLKEDDKTEELNSILGNWFNGRWGEKDRMPDERVEF